MPMDTFINVIDNIFYLHAEQSDVNLYLGEFLYLGEVIIGHFRVSFMRIIGWLSLGRCSYRINHRDLNPYLGSIIKIINIYTNIINIIKIVNFNKFHMLLRINKYL